MTKEIIFDHESLQDRKSIKKYLKVITDGLAKGVISFNDGVSQTTLEPDGLVVFRVTASHERERKNLTISLNWKDPDAFEAAESHSLKISSEDAVG